MVNWNVAKRMLKYVESTLYFESGFEELKFLVERFSNADWAGNVDDRKSSSDYLFDPGSGVTVRACKLSFHKYVKNKPMLHINQQKHHIKWQ